MNIVLNEHKWAKDMITSRSLGKKPFETLSRVARYYIDNDCPKKEVRKMLDSFLLQCEPTASLPRWSDTIDYALDRALKNDAIKIDYICITKPEMKKIDSLQGRQIRRLAFTLLCLAKYWDAVNPRGDHWVNSKDSDIMRMANINTSIKRQSLMYNTLNAAGMVRFSKKVDNTNVRVCFIEDGDTAIKVSDFRNLGYQYLKYHGEPYFKCQNCGITTKYNNPTKGTNQRYCSSCSVEVVTQQKINSVMRIRGEENKCPNDKKYTVYMHVFPDKKVYIGLTEKTLRDAWSNGHAYRSSSLSNAIESYGWDNVKHYIIYECSDKGKADTAKAFAIKSRRSYIPKYGYNTNYAGYTKVRQNDSPELISVEVDGNGRRVD